MVRFEIVYCQVSLTQVEGRSSLSLVLAQHVDKSPSIKTEEADHPRSPKSEHSSEGFR